MSTCTLYAIAAAALLAASFSTMTVSETQNDILRNKFSSELDIRYNAIVSERRNHYIQGLLLGAVLSFFAFRRTAFNNTFHKTAAFTALTLLTGVLYYYIMPKSDYMLNHLKTAEENVAWLEVYKTMKSRYYIGFVLGALAAVPLAQSFC